MSYSQTNGGGYMDTSFDGSSSNNNSNGYAKKPMGEQTMRPLTVKQLKNASIPQENTFKIDGVDVTQVTFIGVIRNIQEMATNYVYTIEDGTGAIEVRKWVEQNETAEEAEARRMLTPETYVRVNGRLNSFSNRITVVSHAIRPIQDFNEITYHLLDTIETHLKFVKPSSSSSSSSAIGGAGSSMDIDSHSTNNKNSIIDRVNEVIQSFDGNVEGGTIDQIVFKLKGLYSETQVRETVDYLQNEGQCYTTIDDNHVKSCLP